MQSTRIMFTTVPTIDHNETSSVACGNNSAVLLPYQAEWEAAQWVVLRVLMPAVSIPGAIGNALTISVLTRKWMKSSTNYYLTALALCDLLYLVAALTLSLPLHLQYLIYVKCVVDTCSNVAVWMILTFTVERYIAVCHPLLGRRICTPRRACYCIAIVALAAAIITAPGFFEFSAEPDECGQLSWVQSGFGLSNGYVHGYVYVNQTCFTFMPLTLLLIFNILLVRSVARASRERRQMSCDSQRNISGNNAQQSRRHKNSEQTRITVMLICVVFMFLVCQLPQAVMNIYIKYVDRNPQEDKTNIIRIVNCVCNLLVMFNAAVNFALYSAFSSKFRRTFAYVICRRQNEARKQPIMHTNTHSRAGPHSAQHFLPPSANRSHSGMSKHSHLLEESPQSII